MEYQNKNLYAVISASAVILFMILFPFVFNFLTKQANDISSLSISKYELPETNNSLFAKIALLPDPADKSQNIITTYEKDQPAEETEQTETTEEAAKEPAETEEAATPETAPTSTETTTYENSKYKFSLAVPKDYIVMEQYIYEEVPGIRLKFAKSQADHSYGEASIKLDYYRYDTTTSIDVLKIQKQQDDLQVSTAVALIIDQIEAIKYHFGTTPPKHLVYSAKGTDGLIFELNPEDKNSIEILEYLVKTFKFSPDVVAVPAATEEVTAEETTAE